MPIDPKAVADYAAELADAAGIPADQRPAFLANEKVLATARKRFEDIERETGRVAAEKRRADEIEAKRLAEYENNLKIFNDNKKIVEDVQAQVKAYEDQYGPLSPGERKQVVQDAIDKKSLEAELGKRDQLTIGLVVAASKITARHLKTFNEEPDFDAIQKIAVEQGLTAEKAYDAWVAPKVEERRNAASEAALKAAREEGFKEGVSKSAAGTITDAAPKSPFMENLRKAGQSSSTARDSFLSAWREPVGAKQ